LVEHGQDWQYFLCEFLAGRRQPDALRVGRGVEECGAEECGADGVFELVDLTDEDGLPDAEVFSGLVEVGVPGNGKESLDAL
jgi:hypothetical protein